MGNGGLPECINSMGTSNPLDYHLPWWANWTSLVRCSFFFPFFWHGEVYMKLWTMTHGWACSKRIPAEQLSQAPSFNRACGWGLNLATYELQPSKPMLESQRPALSQPNLPSVKNCRDPLHGIWFNGVSTRVYRQNLFIWSQNKKHFVQSVFVE